ncbi:phage holin, partial [Klebsiella pneumoniae]|uniref:phage holin n=1 Tax=Klebsiella pneumoniae TaxID=573 RepID=UPI003A84C6F0
KNYKRVKWLVSVVLPALGTLVGTLGKAYGWAQTDLAVTTLAAITTFLGGTMLHSTAQYNKTEEAPK